MDAADRAAEGDDDDDDAEMTWAEELQRGATVPLANFRGDPRTLLENQVSGTRQSTSRVDPLADRGAYSNSI
jgi:hypothetical protein